MKQDNFNWIKTLILGEILVISVILLTHLIAFLID